MDLSAIYSKTPKGLRARASLIGGLSSHLMKVLTHVDGASKSENILLKFDKLTPQQLSADLIRLEQEGYIRLSAVTANSDAAWALTSNFAPMIVEEYQSEEALNASAKADAELAARMEAEQKALEIAQTKQAAALAAKQQAVLEQEAKLAAQQKADKKAQKLHQKEKVKAEKKVQAQLQQERVATQLAARQFAAQQLAAQQLADQLAALQAEKLAAQARQKAEANLKAEKEKKELERQAKLEAELQHKATLKAREAAEIAQQAAEQKANESARREIERIARDAEEAQKKRETENKAKLEAERVAEENLAKEAAVNLAAEQARLKTKADARARLLAEEQLQQKLEQEQLAQQRVQAEAAAKLQQQMAQEKAQKDKENAHLEIANIMRKAEEDRKKAAAIAKEQKLEAKRKAKANLEMQQKTLRLEKEAAKRFKAQTKSLAQQQTKAEAKQKPEQVKTVQVKTVQVKTVQVKAETVKAKPQNIPQENLQAPLEKTQVAEEVAIKASADAEEQANIAARENGRLEMARIAQEAEAVRQKSSETNKPIDAAKSLPSFENFDANEAAEEAAFAAEERAAEAGRKNVPKLEKATKQIAEDTNRADIRQAALDEALQREKLIALTQPKIASKWLKKISTQLTKLLLIYLPISLLLLVGLLHFVNISMLIQPIEQLASDSLGEPVHIKKVRASIWPQPHLVLEDVLVGNKNQQIEVVHVLPSMSSLFEQTKRVKSLVIEGMKIEQTNFGQPLQWLNQALQAKNINIEQINLKNIQLKIRDFQLEPFDGKVLFSEEKVLQQIDLVSSNNALLVSIVPQGNQHQIALKAANWALPFNTSIVFNTLNAKGIVSQNQINFNEITGELYDGTVSAKALINWPIEATNAKQWLSTGSFNLQKVNVNQLLSTFASAINIDGKLNLNGSFTTKSAEAFQLANAATINANFDIRQGNINNIELARAVLARGSQSLAGDNTSFDKLTGTLTAHKGQYQYGKLVLASPQFNASGYINIAANQTVSGRINADLATQSRRLQANFTVIGRGKDLKSN